VHHQQCCEARAVDEQQLVHVRDAQRQQSATLLCAQRPYHPERSWCDDLSRDRDETINVALSETKRRASVFLFLFLLAEQIGCTIRTSAAADMLYRMVG